MQLAAHSHGASLSESRVPAQLITIVVPGRAVANAMMQRLGFISPHVCVSVRVSFLTQPFSGSPHDNPGQRPPSHPRRRDAS